MWFLCICVCIWLNLLDTLQINFIGYILLFYFLNSISTNTLMKKQTSSKRVKSKLRCFFCNNKIFNNIKIKIRNVSFIFSNPSEKDCGLLYLGQLNHQII